MAETRPIIDGVALHKAQLIHDALETLRASNQIDERDDLTAASFLEWYDLTIPDVKDIKILAGAMEIEMTRRRGERIIKEGEQRGRPEKGSDMDPLLSNAERMNRKKARLLAEEPEAVTRYIKREQENNRVPTVHGAIGLARVARATAAPQRRSKQLETLQARHSEFDEQVFDAITKIADGKRRTDAQVAILSGYQTAAFLQRIRLIPWLRIERTAEGLRFQIDEELRAICEDCRPRPHLSYQSINQFLRDLRAELTRRRKENHDEFEKRRWNSELILKREQTTLLDWIEQQLDRVSPL